MSIIEVDKSPKPIGNPPKKPLSAERVKKVEEAFRKQKEEQVGKSLKSGAGTKCDEKARKQTGCEKCGVLEDDIKCADCVYSK